MSDAANSFVDNWDYLKVELNWVDRLLQLAVARQRQETKVIDRVAQTKGDRVTSHWWKGLVALEGQVTYDTPPNDHHPAATAPPKIGYQQQLEARIQASYQQGIVLGLPTLRDRLHLTKFEKNLVLLALAPEVNQRYARLYAYLQGQEQAQLPSVNLILKLLCANDAEWRVAREQLAVASPLRHLGLVELLPESASALLNRSVKLADALVNYLLAETPTLQQLEDLLHPLSPPAIAPHLPKRIAPSSPSPRPPAPTVRTSGFLPAADTLSQASSGMTASKATQTVLQSCQLPVTWSDLVLPAALMLQLQALTVSELGSERGAELGAELLIPPAVTLRSPSVFPGTIALFAGPPGTGKTTAAAAIAHHWHQPLTWIDLATVHPDAYLELVATIVDQAPIVLFLRSAHTWFGPRAAIAPTTLAAFCQHRRQVPGLTLLSVPQRSAVRLQWQGWCDRILTFPRPDAMARRHLWQKAFSTTLPPIATLDWHPLAQIPTLSGGEIQQIVQLAASLATVAQSPVVEHDHLITALEHWRQRLPPAEIHARHLDQLDWATVVTDLPTPRTPPRRKRPAPRRAKATHSPNVSPGESHPPPAIQVLEQTMGE